jgi:hypothetical protein
MAANREKPMVPGKYGQLKKKRQPDAAVCGMGDATGKKDDAVDHHEGAHDSAYDAG